MGPPSPAGGTRRATEIVNLGAGEAAVHGPRGTWDLGFVKRSCALRSAHSRASLPGPEVRRLGHAVATRRTFTPTRRLPLAGAPELADLPQSSESNFVPTVAPLPCELRPRVLEL
jgi:hypothetical protein